MRIVHDGVEPVSEFKFDNGALYERCYYEGLARPYMVDNGLIGVAGCGLLLTDDRGSVVGVVNPSQGSVLGEIVEKLHYNMTGLCRAYAYDGANDTEKFRADGSGYNLGRSEKVPFGYLGMYHDPFTGLYHTHFREYDAIHGRWLSEDPAGYADGLNLYQAYMGVNGTDPLGLNDDVDDWVAQIYGRTKAGGAWANRVGHVGSDVMINTGRAVVEPVVAAYDAATNTASALTGNPIGTNHSMTFEKGGFLDNYESLKREALTSGATPWEAQFTASFWSAGEYTGINNLANAVQGEKITYDVQGGLAGQEDVSGWGRAWEGAQGVGKLISCYAMGAKGAGYLRNVKNVEKVADPVTDTMRGLDKLDELDDTGRAVGKVDEIGEYGRVGGHHVHAQAGFMNHVSYDPDKGFSISQKYMLDRNWDHTAMSTKQHQLFIELAKSGRPNTMREHTNIAVAALKAGGATTQEARDIVSQSLRNLRRQGVRKPSHIPWEK